MLENIKYRRTATAWIAGILAAAALFAAVPLAAMPPGQGPKISVYGTEVPVGKLFRQIEEQCGYTFAYNKSALDLSRTVSVEAVNTDISDVLDLILKDSGFTYIINDKHIVILPYKEDEAMTRRNAPAPARLQPYTPKPAPVYEEPAYRPEAVRPEPEHDYPAEEAMVYVVVPVQQAAERIYSAPAENLPLTPLKLINVPESPRWALKTNLLFDVTTTMNLGFEVRLSRKWTMEVTGSYNPWSWPDNRKWKIILVQPEARLWLCDPFAGHFLGVHAHWAHYNIGNLPFGSLRDNRYQGDLAGAGISYGYSWYLGRRWALEATIGVGYTYLWYQRFDQEVCGNCYGWEDKHYIGVSKVGISLSYLIK